MITSNAKDQALFERKARVEKGLELLGSPEAKALTTEIDERTVALNDAEAAAAKGETAGKAEQEAKATEVDLEAVLAVVPFMVRIYDPGHFASLPKAESFEGTSVDFHRERLAPALHSGGHASQFMAKTLDEALTRRDKARARFEAAGKHDVRVKEREIQARQELAVALHNAEIFITSNSAPGDEARMAIKRPKKVDTRTPEEIYADDLARAGKRAARLKAIADRKATKRSGKKGADSTPSAPPAALPAPGEVGNPAPALTVVQG